MASMSIASGTEPGAGLRRHAKPATANAIAPDIDNQTAYVGFKSASPPRR